MKASHLTSYFDEAFFGFVFWWRQHFDFVFWWRFLWLHTWMKASHFDFIFWRMFHFSSEKWRLLTLASYFDECFLLWIHILTKASHFDFIFWQRFNYFYFFLWKMKASHLGSYFDECFFGFIFWWRLHTLYFDEGFIFSLKNEGFTHDFVFWRSFLWFRILTKATLWLRISTKVSLASYFDKGFTL
jgi:hypothetical protein